MIQEEQEAVQKLKKYIQEGCSGGEPDKYEMEECLWQVLLLFQEVPFYTAKGLDFTYHIKGNEIFFSRKDKSITRATVMLGFYAALSMRQRGELVTGPKKLGCFGASYLYPVFIALGIIEKADKKRDNLNIKKNQ
ncbi:MAG: hypothetical protein Q4E89_08835 [Eubacteriales bacterium]|nr:hypothetical protein [Eubacteriales bacterium]